MLADPAIGGSKTRNPGFGTPHRERRTCHPHGCGGSWERRSAVSANRARVSLKEGVTRPNKQGAGRANSPSQVATQ